MGKKPKNSQSDSAGMVAALDAASKENYLGDPQVVGFLLRNYANTCLQRRSHILGDVTEDSPEWPIKRTESAQADYDDARRLADVFLGKNKMFNPIPAFNRPGVIDRWLVDELHVAGDSPEEVVNRAVVTFLLKFYDMANIIAATPENEDTDDTNQMMIDGLMQKFTKLVMGIPDWDKE
jgi:hypothetical protein